jgi:quercetin dioxygenase-like cupin family protein
VTIAFLHPTRRNAASSWRELRKTTWLSIIVGMPIIHRPATHTHELESTRFTTLAAPSTGSQEASVWQVEIQPGTDPVPHELTREEVVVILSGTARASLNAKIDEVGAGGTIVIPADTPFSLTASGSEPLVALAYLPVGGQARIQDHEPFTPPWAQ